MQQASSMEQKKLSPWRMEPEDSYWNKPALNPVYYFIVGAFDDKESSHLKC